jgi:hypothetical protein
MEVINVNDRHPNFRDANGNLFLFTCYSCTVGKGFENDLSFIPQGICSNCGWDDAKIIKPISNKANGCSYTEEEMNEAVAKFKRSNDLRQDMSIEVLKFIALNNKFSFEELINFYNETDSIDILITTIAACQENNILTLDDGFMNVVAPAIELIDDEDDDICENEDDDSGIQEMLIRLM